MSFRWVMSAATKWRYHHFISYYMLFIRSEAHCQTGMSCSQWTANSSQKSIFGTQKLLKLLCMENKKRTTTKGCADSAFQHLYFNEQPAKAYYCPKLWFTLSRCDSSCQRFLPLSSQNIMLFVPICLSFPHFWYLVNVRVLSSLTWEQKPTKLAQQMKQILYLKSALLTFNTL